MTAVTLLSLIAGLCVSVQATWPAPAAAAAASSRATLIAAGNAHACMILSGTAYCWGSNSNGQLGDGSTISSTSPVPVYTGGVLAGRTLTQIVAGASFTCALDSTGLAYCWGLDTSGQLGNNSTTQSLVPVAVTASGVLAGKTLAQLAAGNAHVDHVRTRLGRDADPDQPGHQLRVRARLGDRGLLLGPEQLRPGG